uniref:Uncharacterized protein n=1 Tax=Glossina brevipalpis TaxID=37001 RepID=A0A1A9VZK7_9MUSC
MKLETKQSKQKTNIFMEMIVQNRSIKTVLLIMAMSFVENCHLILLFTNTCYSQTVQWHSKAIEDIFGNTRITIYNFLLLTREKENEKEKEKDFQNNSRKYVCIFVSIHQPNTAIQYNHNILHLFRAQMSLFLALLSILSLNPFTFSSH